MDATGRFRMSALSKASFPPIETTAPSHVRGEVVHLVNEIGGRTFSINDDRARMSVTIRSDWTDRHAAGQKYRRGVVLQVD